MLDVAIRKADGSAVVDWAHVGVRTTPPLPVDAALRPVLPDGLRRGSTVSVAGSLSLLFALLGAASADGAWCVLVGFPRLSAEAAHEYGLNLARVALVPSPGAGWTTAIGALLDTVDVVATRPPRRVVAGDVRRLAARARSKDAVLVPYVTGRGDVGRSGDPADEWPGADVRLTARAGAWTGTSDGGGRLRARRVEVSAGGRGRHGRDRSASLWLPADGGGCASAVDVGHIGRPDISRPDIGRAGHRPRVVELAG